MTPVTIELGTIRIIEGDTVHEVELGTMEAEWINGKPCNPEYHPPKPISLDLFAGMVPFIQALLVDTVGVE